MPKKTILIVCIWVVISFLLQGCTKPVPVPSNTPPAPKVTTGATLPVPKPTGTERTQQSAVEPVTTQQQNSLALPSSSVGTQTKESVSLPVVDDTWKKGMNVYSRKGFSLPDKTGYDFTLLLYTDAQKSGSDFHLDVGQNWGLTLKTDKGEYVVVDRQYINHGGIDYYPFFKIDDTTGQYDYDHLFILTTMSYAAGITVFEFSYDVKAQTMSQKSVYDESNTNPF